jgi:hypothetical protein
MPWQQSLFPLLIVTSSPGTFSGLFTYSPAPGPGHLTGSQTAGDGTDPYGNAYVHGIISYEAAGGLAIAQGWQDGSFYFATAPTQAGPYVPASGSLRAIVGPLPNGFSIGTDVNGTTDGPSLTQIDAGTIIMAGRLVTPGSGPVLLTTFGTIGPPFVLPAASAPVPEFPTGNAGGNQGGSVILRPNGNLQLTGNFGNGVTVFTSGTFHF